MQKPNWRCIRFFCICLCMGLSPHVLGASEILDSGSGFNAGFTTALGGPNPSISQDINGYFSNPASFGGIPDLEVLVGFQNVLQTFDYQSLVIALPWQAFTFGLGYGAVKVDGIDQTTQVGGVINPIDTFSTRKDTFYGTVAYSKSGLPLNTTLRVGATGKQLTQTIQNLSRTGYGLDLGAVVDFPVRWRFLDGLSLGASLANAVSTKFKWEGSGATSVLEKRLSLGATASLFTGLLSVNTQWTQGTGLGFGLSGKVQDTMTLNGGYADHTWRVGMVLNWDNLNFLDDKPHRFQLNYAYAPADLNEAGNTQAFSFAYIGGQAHIGPKIVQPAMTVFTKEKEIRLAGTASPGQSLILSVNSQFLKPVTVDSEGLWSVDRVPLLAGENRFVLQTAEIFQGENTTSNTAVVIQDNQAPVLDSHVEVVQGRAIFTVESSEPLSSLTTAINQEPQSFQQVSSLKWRLVKPVDLVVSHRLTADYGYLSTTAVDMAGNSGTSQTPFFIKVIQPRIGDTLYRSQVRVVAEVSPDVDSVRIGGDVVRPNANHQIASTVSLVPGKQEIPFLIQFVGGDSIEQVLPVVRVIQAKNILGDLPGKRELEALATAGLVPVDPESVTAKTAVSRVDLLATIYRVKNIQIPKASGDVFRDVAATDSYSGIVQYAVEKGHAFPFPDGNFRPDAAVSVSDAFSILSSAGVVRNRNNSDASTFTWLKFAQFLVSLPDVQAKLK